MKKILIAIPSGNTLDVDFVKSLLSLQPIGNVDIHIEEGSLVYVAREKLSLYAIEEEFDYVLWLDSDMVFEPDLLKRLLIDDKPVVAGLFFTRRPPYQPAVWTKLRVGSPEQEKETVRMVDVPEEGLTEIDACGMAAVLVKTTVLSDVYNRYGTIFSPIVGYGEDISFCIRAKNCGHSIWLDADAKVGHKGMAVITQQSYEAYRMNHGG